MTTETSPAEGSQQLQIIKAFSAAEVPESVIRNSNIKDLIKDMLAAQESAESSARRLDRARTEKKDGNFLGNWWHDRGDKVDDAQLDLNKAIGALTQKSAQLLIVNTAISKVLNDQQGILLKQQVLLKEQTDALEQQNRKILEQQTLLEQQQKEINAANQGLLEAKGLTQEQAQKLVGCVVRVSEAEQKIEIANEQLRTAVAQSLRDVQQRLAVQLDEHARRADSGIGRVASENALFRTELAGQVSQSGQEMAAIVEQSSQAASRAVAAVEFKQAAAEQKFTQGLADTAGAVSAVEQQLSQLQAAQQSSAARTRVFLMLAAALSIASLAWQVSARFAA